MTQRSRGAWLAAAVLVLAACGDSGEPSPATTAPPPPTTAVTTTAPPPTPTTVPPATAAPGGGICTPLPAGATTVDVTPAWRSGDSVRLSIGLARSGNRVTPSDRTWTATVTVLDVLDEGYVLQWETDEQVIDPEALAAIGVAGDAIERLDELSRKRIEYVADTAGAFVGIVNVEELMANSAEQLAIFEDEVFDNDASDEVQVITREVLGALATDPELAEVVFGESLRVYHGLYGALADTGEPITGPATLPNPLGAERFPATQVQELVTVADAEGCAVLATTTTPDPAELDRILDQIAAAAGDAAAVAPLLEGFTVGAERRYRWDPGSGWMIEVEARETTSSALVDQSETTTITAVPTG